MFILKRIKYNSPVVLTYAILSFLVLLGGELTEGRLIAALFCVYRSSLTDILFYPRLIGHVLGHAGFEHYFNNFIIILLIGPMLEEKYGSKKLLILISLTALITGLLHVLFFNTALLGASGVVFMMIILGSFVNPEKGKIPVTLILASAIFIGQEIIGSLTLTDNISQLTHIIGGVCGGAMGYVINKNIEHS